MATSMPNGQPNRLVDRISALEGRANTPMTCVDCGSTFFIKLSAEQFAEGGYGSAEFRSLSMLQEPVYICLCGRLAETKQTGTMRGVPEGTHGRFLLALRDALKHQSEGRLDMDKLAGVFVTVQELEALQAKVEELEAIVQTIQAPVTEDGEEVENTDKPPVANVTEPEAAPARGKKATGGKSNA